MDSPPSARHQSWRGLELRRESSRRKWPQVIAALARASAQQHTTTAAGPKIVIILLSFSFAKQNDWRPPWAPTHLLAAAGGAATRPRGAQRGVARGTCPRAALRAPRRINRLHPAQMRVCEVPLSDFGNQRKHANK